MKAVKVVGIAAAVLAGASALGVPVAGFASALGMLAFVLAAGAIVVGAADLAKPLMMAFVGCLVVALFAKAAGAWLRTPEAQALLCVALALALGSGLLSLAAKAATLEHKRPRRPPLPLMERAAVVDPAPTQTAARSERRSRDGDDLGIFGRRGGAP